MNINAIIIDDEKFCIETLLWEISQNCPSVNVLTTCTSGKEGIASISKYRPDLVFLDIEMPYMNAFEMLKEIENIDFDIIFTTAYDQFAIKAIKINALDYLLKPIGSQDLIEAVEKIKRKKSLNQPSDDIEKIIKKILRDNYDFEKIALPTIEGLELIHPEEILYVEAHSNYAYFHLTNNKKIVISKTLKQVSTKLDNYPFFYRIHQSYIINLNHLLKYQKGSGGSIILDNSTLLPVARNRKEGLLTLLKNS